MSASKSLLSGTIDSEISLISEHFILKDGGPDILKKADVLRATFRPLKKLGIPSFVMLGLVPSICIRWIGQQILGTRPRMTPARCEICHQTEGRCMPPAFDSRPVHVIAGGLLGGADFLGWRHFGAADVGRL
ncbi:hypothetical protein ACWGRJ_47380, partial [Bradyrhizobium sp. Lot11]